MAIIPSSQYPGKITPASTEYPYGSARDVSSPGAGDGTPLQQAWVNDIWGFHQKLLQSGGVTPSGNPDSVSNSDYFTALDSYIRSSASDGIVGTSSSLKINVPTASATATVTADEVILGESLGGKKYKLSSISKVINLSTTGAGGMDSGSAPSSGWVAIYFIYNPTTKTSALLATNATGVIAPNVYGGSAMPSGYTASALVSVWRTTSGSILQNGYQFGRRISRPRVDVLVTSSNPGGYTAIPLSQAVPQNAVALRGYAFCNSGTGAGAATLVLAEDTNGVGFIQVYAGTTGAIGSDIYFEMLIPVVQNIFYQFSWTTSGVSNATVGVSGYEI